MNTNHTVKRALDQLSYQATFMEGSDTSLKNQLRSPKLRKRMAQAELKSYHLNSNQQEFSPKPRVYYSEIMNEVGYPSNKNRAGATDH